MEDNKKATLKLAWLFAPLPMAIGIGSNCFNILKAVFWKYWDVFQVLNVFPAFHFFNMFFYLLCLRSIIA